MELIPDENSLTNIKKKSIEPFREYAIRWREQAARVKPPMKESKIVEVFIQAQDEIDYQHLLPVLGKPFIEVLKMGEMIEDEIKTGRIWARSRRPRRHHTQAQAQVHDQDLQNHSQNPLYSILPPLYPIYNAQPYVQSLPYPQWCAPTSQSHLPSPQTYQRSSRPDFWSKPNNEIREKSRDSFTPIGDSYESLFQRLGHSIEDCHALKREIEKMIQDKSIMVQNIDSEESSSHTDMKQEHMLPSNQGFQSLNIKGRNILTSTNARGNVAAQIWHSKPYNICKETHFFIWVNYRAFVPIFFDVKTLKVVLKLVCLYRGECPKEFVFIYQGNAPKYHVLEDGARSRLETSGGESNGA
ncbi:hypothetical protein FXO38_12359 [Capsicum annuum]|nr:hypothetical protein FXO37_15951 [Capsicum annuum]KAF3659989.1 hypothetical protein FXO38_12359 [Capsicum annuum]